MFIIYIFKMMINDYYYYWQWWFWLHLLLLILAIIILHLPNSRCSSSQLTSFISSTKIKDKHYTLETRIKKKPPDEAGKCVLVLSEAYYNHLCITHSLNFGIILKKIKNYCV